MKKFKRAMGLFLVLILSLSGLFAKGTPVENLHKFDLENGLTLFVAENHSVPLTYIEIAVRTGAVDQTPEDAGLFHLYEHMMFKGNELYPNAAAIQNALSDMGVADWNGTTGNDRVNYFITVPSSLLEKGLAFWNAAIRTPLMDPKEFENEKKVVISEISGYAVDSGNIYGNYISSSLFPDAPYRMDPSGPVSNVRNATIAQLRDIQRRYYIPSNSALFVGGDVDPEATYELVKKIYGTWSNNGNSASVPHDQQNRAPFSGVKLAVMPFDKLSPYMAEVDISFRGPDADFNENDTYAADYLFSLLSEPDGFFKTSLVADPEFGIPQPDYVSAGYATCRANGRIGFTAIMLNPETNLPNRALKFLDKIKGETLPKIAADKALYKKSKAKQIVSVLEKYRNEASDTATGLLSELRFWWTTTSYEYYCDYFKKMGAVSQKSVQKFLDEYILSKDPLITILVNPAVYEQTAAQYRELGFEMIGAENAYWWNDKKFAPDPKKIAAITDSSSPEKQGVYKPSEDGGHKSVFAGEKNVAELKLKNGIPVYVLSDKSKKMASVSICLRGGVSHITPATSGLEDALFSMMALSSQKYGFDQRQKLSFETGASIYSNSVTDGSTLSLSVLEESLYKMLPVLTDGFVNPAYEQKVYDDMMIGYGQQIQATLNDPASLLIYTAEKAIYKGHPYETSADVREDSVDNITIDAMKALHSEIISPEDIFIVAVGNINAKKLVSELNKSVGKLCSKNPSAEKSQAAQKEISAVKIGGEPLVLTHKDVAGNGYVLRAFEAPSFTDAEFIPSVLAGDIYSDIMFNVVREKHGVCYTPSSSISGSKASVGIEFLVNLTGHEKFARVMSEARNLMAQDKVITGLDAQGGYAYESIENCLERYKNKYINATYASLASTRGKASTLVYNLLQYDDLYHDHKVVQSVMDCTSADILSAFKKYWIDGGSRWFVITGPEDKARLNFKE